MTTTTDPLVSTDWLAAHLYVKIVDASYKMPGITPPAKEDYLKAHIPGAVFFDVDAVVTGGVLPRLGGGGAARSVVMVVRAGAATRSSVPRDGFSRHGQSTAMDKTRMRITG